VARQRIDTNEVVTTAVTLIDDPDADELALARVAEELGVQSSALYNHVDGLDGLRHAVAVRAGENLGEMLRDAAVARSGDDAVLAVARAYRTFAHEHPGQHAAALLPPDDTTGDLDDARSAIPETLARVVLSYGCDEATAARLARSVHSTIHGYVALEATDSPGLGDADARFEDILHFVLVGLHGSLADPT